MSGTKHLRFIKKLGEHVEFIRNSSEAFDVGSEHEAFRIGTSLRVIFHQTPKSNSLIKHLGYENKRILSSSKGHDDSRDFLSWNIDLNRNPPVITVPTLASEFHEVTIRDWWDKENAFKYKGQGYTRKRIILAAVNQDGGAHVDENLQGFYEALAAGTEGISITGNLEYGGGPPPFEQGVRQATHNAHLALLRQFAHEFLRSVKHFHWV